MSGFIDIEDALQAALNGAGFDAHAKPLPQAFGTPCVTVDMLNAWDDNAAQALYSVDFDCRAEDAARAMELQLAVANWVRALPGTSLLGKPVYALEPGSPRLQRCEPDQSHQNVTIATVSATLRVRVAD